MSRSTLRGAFAALAFLTPAISFAPAPLAAQEQPKPAAAAAEPVHTCPYTLAHADPRETAGVLLALFQGQEPAVRITCDDRTNTIIVFATEPVHRHIQSLLETLDRKVAVEQGNEETRIIRVQHHPIDSFTQVAELHHIEFALARATNSFIARGRTAELDRFAATLAALDIDTPAIELEGWILEFERGEPIEKVPDLAPLAAELARSGLVCYCMSSHWSVRSLAGERFRSHQEFQGRRLDKLTIEGQVRLVDEGRNAQIALGVEVRVLFAAAAVETAVDQRGSFQVETTLETQPGKLVVVGLAPTGDEQSKPLVLVVRVKQ